MFFTKNHVRDAVAAAGGPTKASNDLGVSNATIHNWIAAGRVPNLDLAKKLSMLSAMPVLNLRPI